MLFKHPDPPSQITNSLRLESIRLKHFIPFEQLLCKCFDRLMLEYVIKHHYGVFMEKRKPSYSLASIRDNVSALIFTKTALNDASEMGMIRSDMENVIENLTN